ncbi:TIGR00725 family protein [PVC group bacterium (ex Bugula neritina AB1)]|nr:TIGR00725 family protein [PVC group bacterium (ex Bugula neritina AB1)]
MGPSVIIGVMGGADHVSSQALNAAESLGKLIAKEGWILLTGGRNLGIMDVACRGAKEAGGLTLGILPDEKKFATSSYVDIPIYTGMGEARNVINVLSSDVVVACPGASGTISEVALALKSSKPVIAMGFDDKGLFSDMESRCYMHRAQTPEETITLIKKLLQD